MTIAKTLYKFLDFIFEYGELPTDNFDEIYNAASSFFGKSFKSVKRKLEVISKLNFIEEIDTADTLDEYYQLTEKGAEYLRKNEVTWLKFGFGTLGTVIGAAAIAIFDVIKSHI